MDLKGVLIPEVWIAFAEVSGIPELRRTTRNESDYDKLIHHRIDILKKHSLGLRGIRETIVTIDPMPDAREFLSKLRNFTQVIILSDTFTQFASSPMEKPGYPTILYSSLKITESGGITDFRVRIKRSKLTTVHTLQSIGYETIASGDSYDDLGMIEASKTNFLFRTTREIRGIYPQYPVFETYAELPMAIKTAQRRDEQGTASQKEAVFPCTGNRSVYTSATTGGEGIRMTKATFDEDPRELCFTAGVFSLTKRTVDGETCFTAVLNRTASLPEQGGQKAGRDALDEVKIPGVTTRDGIITHLVNALLSVGSTVTGVIDWTCRFGFIQQHTSEHMLSELAYRLFGAENVGFHLSEREVQVGLSVPLDAVGLVKLESTVGKAIFQDILVRAFCPDAAEPVAISYRQEKELTGVIRLVEVRDVDTYAHCTPHVARSLGAGLVEILSTIDYKGDTRLYLVYRMRALTMFSAHLGGAKETSARLSAPLGELDGTAMKVQEKSAAAKSRAIPLAVELILARVETAVQKSEQVLYLVLPPPLESMLQHALKPLRERFSGVLGLFPSAEETGYAFLLSGNGVDQESFLAEIRSRDGKSDGGKDCIQDRVFCKATEIPVLFHDFVKDEK